MPQIRTGHIPTGLYFTMLKAAHENRMTVAQLHFELLRFAVGEKLGYSCPHDERDRKWSRKIRMFYCVNCFTFFTKVVGSKGAVTWQPRPPVWEIKQTMTAQEWAAMPKADNGDLK